MHPRSLASISALALSVALAAPAAAQGPMRLSLVGGSYPGSLSVALEQGPIFQFGILAMGIDPGPIPIAVVDPADFRMLDVGVGPRVPVAALPIDSLPVGNGDGSGGEGGSCTSRQTSGCGCCSPLDVDVRSSRGDLLDEPLEEEVSAPVVGMGSSDSAGGGGASLSASPPDGEQPWSCVGKQ